MPYPAWLAVGAAKKAGEKLFFSGKESSESSENNESKRGSFKRKAAFGALAVATAVSVWYGAKEYGENQKEAVVPHEDGRIEASTALEKVELSGDVELVNAEGESSATMNTEAESCLPGTERCITYPLSGRVASAELDLEMDVMAGENAISLETERNDEGEPYIVANVKEEHIYTEFGDAEPPVYTNDEEFLRRAGAVVFEGDKYESATMYLDTIARNKFSTDCGPETKDAVPAGAANVVENNVEQTAELLKGYNQEGHQVLDELLEQDIHINITRAAQPGGESGRETISVSEMSLDLPETLQPSDSELQFSGQQNLQSNTEINTSECEVSEAASEKLDELKQGDGFVVEKPQQ